MSTEGEPTPEGESEPAPSAPPASTVPTLIIHPCRFGCGFKGYIGQLKGHYTREHKEEYYATRAKAAARPVVEGEDGTIAPPSLTLPSETDMRAAISMEGRIALNKYKRVIMELYLGQMPQISSKSRDYVLTVWNMNTMLQDNPQTLWEEMVHGAGIRAEAAQRIVKAMFDLETKFADVLYRAGTAPIFWSGAPQPQPYPAFQAWPSAQPGYPPPSYGTPQPYYTPTAGPHQPYYAQPQYPPWQPAPQTGVTAKEVEDIIDRKIRAQDTTGKSKEETTEISVPVINPETGEPMMVKGQPFFETIKVPINQAHWYLNNLRSSGGGRRGPSEETVFLQQRIDASEQRTVKLEEELKKERDDRLLDRLNRTEERAQAALEEARAAKTQAQIAQGSSNVYGLMATAVTEGSKKEPIKELARAILGQPTSPKRVEAGAGKAVIERLRGSGLVEERQDGIT